ncbi:FMN-linked oxidoreductase [Tothia fuscella]|uniref:FMN-linked oxidoreductase n=1 Tax=Tothia fuscella TaxID=1048955 RepID=A0A9P4NSZ6_9PEZI|nr:FMN-linked oxidoreductase [Tothia fuscella]
MDSTGLQFDNVAAPKISYYTPQQHIPAGTAIAPQPDKNVIPLLFQPLRLRGLTLQNRIFVSPMCQYSASNGEHTAWHLTHLGGILKRGPGLTIVEATAVTPEGRITPQDSGLWDDLQIEPLKRLTEFAHSQGQHIAIQLGHAGRKASTVAPCINRKARAGPEIGGWPAEVLSVSDVPYDENTHIPRTITTAEIANFKISFIAAVKRAVAAEFDAIEIHAAHGYLLHSFLSPATNTLPSPYGGSLENRMRLLLEITDLTRAAIPPFMPLLVRIPGQDWVEGSGWTSEQNVILGVELSKRGVDLIDVSSGGLLSAQNIISGPSYQASLSAAVKKEVGHVGTLVSAVGMITSGIQAEKILQSGQADVILAGRTFQKNPGLVWQWAEELNTSVRVANQIGWGFGQRFDGGIEFKSVI